MQEKLLQEYPGAIIEGIKRKTERRVSYTTPHYRLNVLPL